MFHHNPSTGHLDQITYMYQNVDSLLASLNKLDQICIPYQLCLDNDCVWPGDFDNNGIADHRDYLTWGVMNGLMGSARNGLVSWRGQYSEDWNQEVSGINAKHGDGDGNGIVSLRDIDINSANFLETNQNYIEENAYPPGSDIVLASNPNFDSQGRIRNFTVRAGHDLHNVLGITFDVEFDTSQFQSSPVLFYWPEDISRLIYFSGFDPYQYLKVSFVQTNNTGINIDSNYLLIRGLFSSFSLKQGLPIPDSTVIKLRNLRAIMPDGTDLLIGSKSLVVYREGVTGTNDFEIGEISVYPNPSDDLLYIEVPYEVSGEIVNVHGQIIKNVILSAKNPIDVSDLIPGVYYLRCQGLSGTYKVVIY